MNLKRVNRKIHIPITATALLFLLLILGLPMLSNASITLPYRLLVCADIFSSILGLAYCWGLEQNETS